VSDQTSAEPATDSVAQLMRASAKPRCMEVELGGGLYGLEVEHVKEVVALRPLSRVFHAPPAIAGVLNLRGEVLIVIDLGMLLTGRPGPRGSSARVVVLRRTDLERTHAGLLVERLGGLREMPSQLQAAPGTLSAAAFRLVAGVIPSPPPCSVLDMTALFQSPELLALAMAGEMTT